MRINVLIYADDILITRGDLNEIVKLKNGLSSDLNDRLGRRENVFGCFE